MTRPMDKDAKSSPTYLPGLNGIRALAASIVLLWHSDEFAYLFDLPSYGYGSTGMAGSAVVLFFVLSGYLITLLLLKEKDRFQTVNVKKFYARRILRIWPVYFVAIVVCALFLRFLPTDQIPKEGFGSSIWMYAFFLPNLAYAIKVSIRSIRPLWSVGVEEQFYLFWPWLFRWAKNLPRILWGIIVAYVALKTSARFLENGPVYQLIRLTAFDCMAVGGLFAWMIHTKHRFLKYVYSKPTQVFCWLFLAISILHKPLQITSLLSAETQAGVYGCIISNVSTNPDTLITLENRLANSLGRISYGLYVYHMPVICTLAYFVKPYILSITPAWSRLGIVIALIFGTTCIIANLSYILMESKLLAMKSKFALVASTDKSRDAQSSEG